MSDRIPKIIGSSINLLSHVSARLAAKLSIEIFSRPQKGRVTKEQAVFLDQADQKVIYCEKTPVMTYHWTGKNDTILLAHGWESNSSRWEELINALNALNYNVIALDAPAHGRSGSPVFNALLYSDFIDAVSQQFRPQIIIGHSVGGMATAFKYSENQYDHLKKLVLLGAPAHFEGVFNRYVDLMGYNKRVETKIHNMVYERFGNWPSYYSIAELSKNFKIPGLIIHDKNDKIIPYEDALLIASKYKNSELVTTKNSGHGLKNKDIYNTVLEFIKA